MIQLSSLGTHEQARRIRAAVGYSNKTAKAIAEELGMKPSSFRRRTSRTNPQGAQSADELYRIAAVCGVPAAFMEEGFARYKPGADLDERLDRIEKRLNALSSQETTRPLSRGVPSSELGLVLEDGQSSVEDLPQTQPPAAGETPIDDAG